MAAALNLAPLQQKTTSLQKKMDDQRKKHM
jgi:hypothetical protein